MSSDSSRSRLSKNNCPPGSQPGESDDSGDRHGPMPVEPRDLPGEAGLRPISVEQGATLREEATLDLSSGVRARQWYRVVNEWREWYDDYRNSHIEYENEDGEIARTALENSYMPEYGKRYYAKLKDFERGVERRFDGLATVMLTFTASTETATGKPRPPADHMRDVADGWDSARKRLYDVLSGYRWEYAKVWEPHKSGYGHMHVAVFVEDGDGDLDAEQFEPVMASHVRNCEPAGSDAHAVEEAVSVSHDVHDLGCYISEYIGIFGDDTLSRSISEQAFYAVTWATNTRRVEFSNGAQRIMDGEQFRRETGLRPEDRGGDCVDRWKAGEAAAEAERRMQVDVWDVRSICVVQGDEPDYHDPTAGGVETVAIDGVDNADPPPSRS